jgi:hypothetical protein
MSELNRLRELAALLRPIPVTEARVKTRADLEKKFKSVEDTIKDLADDLSEGGTIEAMMDDVGVSSRKDAVAALKTLAGAVKTIQSAMMEVEGLLFSAMTEGREPGPVNEMAAIADFSSGWIKGRKAKELVALFKNGEGTADLPDGSKYKAVKPIKGTDLAKGMVVFSSYNAYNQGAHIYEIMGVTKGDSETIAYDSVKEAMKANGCKSLKELDDKIEPHLYVKDLADGDAGPFMYIYNGRWCTGSGAEANSFHAIEKVKEAVKEAKNHMDEHTYQSVASWKRALKAKYGEGIRYVAHEGTIDAFAAEKDDRSKERQVGDWDDTTGTVY